MESSPTEEPNQTSYQRKTELMYNIRAPTSTELETLVEKVTKCFEAAATATGCKLKALLLLTWVMFHILYPRFILAMLSALGK